jgi:hypothetical protein
MYTDIYMCIYAYIYSSGLPPSVLFRTEKEANKTRLQIVYPVTQHADFTKAFLYFENVAGFLGARVNII